MILNRKGTIVPFLSRLCFAQLLLLWVLHYTHDMDTDKDTDKAEEKDDKSEDKQEEEKKRDEVGFC